MDTNPADAVAILGNLANEVLRMNMALTMQEAADAAT